MPRVRQQIVLVFLSSLDLDRGAGRDTVQRFPSIAPILSARQGTDALASAPSRSRTTTPLGWKNHHALAAGPGPRAPSGFSFFALLHPRLAAGAEQHIPCERARPRSDHSPCAAGARRRAPPRRRDAYVEAVARIGEGIPEDRTFFWSTPGRRPGATRSRSRFDLRAARGASSSAARQTEPPRRFSQRAWPPPQTSPHRRRGPRPRAADLSTARTPRGVSAP